MTKKAVFITCVLFGVLFVSYVFIVFNNAKKNQEFQLKNIPIDILTGKNKDTYFLYDNGDLCSVEIIDGELKFAKKLENISHVSFEKDCIALVDKKNKFSFVNSNESHKEVFSNIVNSKGKKIVKITSGDNFTNVLFEDGEVYSDINFINKNAYVTEESFFVFNNIRDMSSGEYQLFALDTQNSIHVISSLSNKHFKKTLTTEIDGALSIYAGERETYVHTQDGEILFFSNDQIFNKGEPKAQLYQNLIDISKITVGINNNVMLAYSKRGFLYHWGYGYIYKKRDKSIPEIIIPEVCFEDNNVKLFKGTHYGIFVITDDDILRIIKN